MFIYMQFNALLIQCLLIVIPFNLYIYHVGLHMYYSAFMAAKCKTLYEKNNLQMPIENFPF